ncbi:hypothetical protein ID866_4488 [Astraeus odoratus]|nr:hypothetical protein ID866_4488 [Astraeus odoratus]
MSANFTIVVADSSRTVPRPAHSIHGHDPNPNQQLDKIHHLVPIPAPFLLLVHFASFHDRSHPDRIPIHHLPGESRGHRGWRTGDGIAGGGGGGWDPNADTGIGLGGLGG